MIQGPTTTYFARFLTINPLLKDSKTEEKGTCTTRLIDAAVNAMPCSKYRRRKDHSASPHIVTQTNSVGTRSAKHQDHPIPAMCEPQAQPPTLQVLSCTHCRSYQAASLSLDAARAVLPDPASCKSAFPISTLRSAWCETTLYSRLRPR
jgi:hypothetical protein